MIQDEGPLDPFLGEDDPTALLGPAEHAEPGEPLSAAERADLEADLAELAHFRRALEPAGVLGIVVDCDDCGERHWFGWDLMAANLRALLGDGRTHVHEPAFAPEADRYVSWDYARGYTDALESVTRRA